MATKDCNCYGPTLSERGSTSVLGFLRGIEESIRVCVGQTTEVDKNEISFINRKKVRLVFIILIVVSDDSHKGPSAVM